MGNNCTPEQESFYNQNLANPALPNYSIDPLLTRYLYQNTAEHLRSHYLDVRGSLTPAQLADFDRSLQSTFGNNRTVAFGSVGVVALALSLFFDVLGTQLRQGTNETTDPVRQIISDQDNEDSDLGVIISDYLKLVPQVANHPERMKSVTAFYENRLREALLNNTWSSPMNDIEQLFYDSTWSRLMNTTKSSKERTDHGSDKGLRQFLNGLYFHAHLMVHFHRIHRNSSNLPSTLMTEYASRNSGQVVMSIFWALLLSIAENPNVPIEAKGADSDCLFWTSLHVYLKQLAPFESILYPPSSLSAKEGDFILTP